MSQYNLGRDIAGYDSPSQKLFARACQDCYLHHPLDIERLDTFSVRLGVVEETCQSRRAQDIEVRNGTVFSARLDCVRK